MLGSVIKKEAHRDCIYHTPGRRDYWRSKTTGTGLFPSPPAYRQSINIVLQSQSQAQDQGAPIPRQLQVQLYQQADTSWNRTSGESPQLH